MSSDATSRHPPDHWPFVSLSCLQSVGIHFSSCTSTKSLAPEQVYLHMSISTHLYHVDMCLQCNCVSSNILTIIWHQFHSNCVCMQTLCAGNHMWTVIASAYCLTSLPCPTGAIFHTSFQYAHSNYGQTFLCPTVPTQNSHPAK